MMKVSAFINRKSSCILQSPTSVQNSRKWPTIQSEKTKMRTVNHSNLSDGSICSSQTEKQTKGKQITLVSLVVPLVDNYGPGLGEQGHCKKRADLNKTKQNKKHPQKWKKQTSDGGPFNWYDLGFNEMKDICHVKQKQIFIMQHKKKTNQYSDYYSNKSYWK